MTSNTTLPITKIGKYQLVAHRATGGMGVVYKAVDEQLGRVVALKVLDPELANNPVLVERFQREARHAARLQHKNIVVLYEADHADGLHYIAMEYIEGIDLSDYIRRKVQLDPEEARRILIQACKALDHAFSHSITHRDIKPSNFLLANEDGRCRIKLTDFGLARLASEIEEDRRVTRAGTTVGTVDYMAPEQARDSALADVRSDIYSLGCTFYHMLAGHPPFSEGGLGERIYKHIAVDPPDIRKFNPAVSSSLWTVIRRMLAKHPDDRFQTPAELIQALRSIAVDSTSPSDQGVVHRPSKGDTLFATQPTMPVRPPSSNSSQVIAPVPPPPPPRHEKPTRSKRPTTLSEMRTISENRPDNLGVTAEQRQAAAAQYERATESLQMGGDTNYALQLLQASCRLDPTTILYRKMLRQVARDKAKPRKSGWLQSLFTSVPSRAEFRAARKANRHREVLDLGEKVLTEIPGDIPTQLAMAEAASALQQDSLALWLLEEARAGAPNHQGLLQQLGAKYEQLTRLKQAIEVWEHLRDLDPTNHEYAAKIRELAVNETLLRGNYRV